MSTASNESQNGSSPRSRRLLVFCGTLVGVLVLVSTLLVWPHVNQGRPPSPSMYFTPGPGVPMQLSPISTSNNTGIGFNPIRHNPNALTPTPKHPTGTAGVTSGSATPNASVTPTASSPTPTITSFSFTAAGDYAQTGYTTANLNYIAHAGVSFHLGLGDFNYTPGASPDAWASYVKGNLPPNFPFEIVPGNEDVAYVPNFIADLPDHIGNISGIYGQEYSFDYPPDNPLARFIMITPGPILPGYGYSAGTAHYNWVAQQIDGARSAGIPWVIVGMHEFCTAMGNLPCTIGSDLENLLISKKVDLVLQGHSHAYQASKQLALNGGSCAGLTPNIYNSACVVSSSTSMTKGAGTVFIITGTGGECPLVSLGANDPEAGYFRTWMAGNSNPTWGVSRFTITATQITGQFIGVSGAGFSDSYTIHA